MTAALFLACLAFAVAVAAIAFALIVRPAQRGEES